MVGFSISKFLQLRILTRVYGDFQFVARSACRCSSDALVKLLGWFALTSAQTEVPLYYRNDCRH